jgi:tetratricopeptide (TPR) repeat protein
MDRDNTDDTTGSGDTIATPGETSSPASSNAFGQRLRTIRQALGMTQADLAAGHLSISYVSMLESGKRAPTTAAVAHLAARLNLEPSDLYEPPRNTVGTRDRLDLAYAEIALHNGDPAAALEVFRRVSTGGVSAAWGEARSLEALGELESACTAFSDVLRRAHILGDLLLSTRASIALARCLGETGEIRQPIEVLQQALRQADEGGLRQADEYVELLSSLVGYHYLDGDLAAATSVARAMIEIVDAGSSRRARGSAYWNAAGIAEAGGDPNLAVTYAERAVALFAEDADQRSLARCATACAWFLLRHPDAGLHLDRAESLLSAAHDTLSQTGSEVDLAYVETEQARVLLLRGESEAALVKAQRAQQRVGLEARAETTSVLLVTAQALQAAGRDDEALAMLDTLSMTLDSLPASRSSAVTWRSMAELYRTMGDRDLAYDALDRALASHGITPEVSVILPSELLIR